MSNAIAAPISTPIVSVNVKTIALLVGFAFLAAFAFYVIGMEEGATALFGKGMLIHEFVHDGRHLLGFPCH